MLYIENYRQNRPLGYFIENLYNCTTAGYSVIVYPKDPQIVPYLMSTLKCSHALTSWTCADFFLKLNNSLSQVVIQSKKSPHKSKLFRRESISKLPGRMALFVGLQGILLANCKSALFTSAQ